MSNSLQHKVVLITGSARGIGAEIAKALAQQGLRLIINSKTSAAEGEQLANLLPDALYLQADVNQEHQCKKLIEDTINHFGQLDILINSAVAAGQQIAHDNFAAATDEIFFQNFQTNVMAPWYLARAAQPYLKRSGGGHIINISSVAGVKPIGISIPYAVSKAALNHLTRLLAHAMGPHIQVNAIAPGLIITERTSQLNLPELYKTYVDTTPLQRPGKANDIAEMVISLLKISNITGQVVSLDSGLS